MEYTDELRHIIDGMKKNLESMNEWVERAEVLHESLEEAKKSYILSPGAEINEKFSNAAKCAIANSEGPLDPDELKNFLAEDVKRKKILTILKKYTEEEAHKVIEQLNEIRARNNQHHMHYKEEQRKLDVNLNKKIETMVAKMKKETEEEKARKRTQPTLEESFKKQRR